MTAIVLKSKLNFRQNRLIHTRENTQCFFCVNLRLKEIPHVLGGR